MKDVLRTARLINGCLVAALVLLGWFAFIGALMYYKRPH